MPIQPRAFDTADWAMDDPLLRAPNFPLETRAGIWRPNAGRGFLRATRETAAAAELVRMQAIGLNTVAVPLLWEGAPQLGMQAGGFRFDRGAIIRGMKPESLGALSPWMLIDPIRSGSPSGKQSPLAKREAGWLCQDVEGRIGGIGNDLGTPGFFCWHTRGFRRLVAQLVEQAAERLPFEAVLLDFSALPVFSSNPREWRCYSGAMVRGMRQELEIEIDPFLRNASPDRVTAVEEWHHAALRNFVATIRARTRPSRAEIAFGAIVRPQRRAEGGWYMPYAPWFEEGLLDFAVLDAEKEQMLAAAVELDRRAGRPIPMLIAGTPQQPLEDRLPAAAGIPHHGWFGTFRTAWSETIPPQTSRRWWRPGAVEGHPLDAAQALCDALAKSLAEVEGIGSFFADLRNYFEGLQFLLDPRMIQKLRDNVGELLASLESGELVLPKEREADRLDIERLVRVLSLVPIPPVPY